MAWLPVRTFENVTRPDLSVVCVCEPSRVTVAPSIRLPELSWTSMLSGTTVMESLMTGSDVPSELVPDVVPEPPSFFDELPPDDLEPDFDVDEDPEDPDDPDDPDLLGDDEGDDDGDDDGGEGSSDDCGAVIRTEASVLLKLHVISPYPVTVATLLTSLITMWLPTGPVAFMAQFG